MTLGEELAASEHYKHVANGLRGDLDRETRARVHAEDHARACDARVEEHRRAEAEARAALVQAEETIARLRRVTPPSVGIILGAAAREDHDWPETPSPVFEDGEGPHWIAKGYVVGVMVAAAGDARCEELCCGLLMEGDSVLVGEDDVREYFDSEAAVAQESWDGYRETCKAAGFDPGRGELFIVVGP